MLSRLGKAEVMGIQVGDELPQHYFLSLWTGIKGLRLNGSSVCVQDQIPNQSESVPP